MIHITVAVLGLLAGAAACIFPSRRTLLAAYGLVAATLASGTYLVIALQAPLLHSCLSGLAYLAVTGVCIAWARRKLAIQHLL